MRVVALETATAFGSVAFIDREANVAVNREFATYKRLSGEILTNILVLEKELWPVNSASLIVVAGGPGSFTGLRVGFAVAKGLSLGIGCPLVTISSLAAIAVGARRDGRVVTFIDARGGQYYYNFYVIKGGKILSEGLPSLGGWNDVRDASEGGVLAGVVADGACRRQMESCSPALLPVIPEARILGELGAEKFRRFGGEDIRTLKPLYLKRGQV